MQPYDFLNGFIMSSAEDVRGRASCSGLVRSCATLARRTARAQEEGCTIADKPRVDHLAKSRSAHCRHWTFMLGGRGSAAGLRRRSAIRGYGDGRTNGYAHSHDDGPTHAGADEYANAGSDA